jgi:acetolactate synthase-1/2/3 large subunit
MTIKYSDQVTDWLVELGYTHCFFLAGGNIMHLLNSARTRFVCTPFVHELSAGIAAEYFNASQRDKKAFVLVTAGPGLTNITTAIAGAWLESRELLVLGGQVKTSDLSSGGIRQRGIQEIDGPSLMKSITKSAIRLDHTISEISFKKNVLQGFIGRPGPIFIEIPLDIQAAPTLKTHEIGESTSVIPGQGKDIPIEKFSELFSTSDRPVLLVGGGVSRGTIQEVLSVLSDIQIPIMTTWNGADRVNGDHEFYFGRPNTWGQRYSNIILQQADLIIAVGTRLGLQQTGFNWKEFAPMANIVQVDIDENELEKENPEISLGIHGDSTDFLRTIFFSLHLKKTNSEWVDFCKYVKSKLPTVENNLTNSGYVSPYRFWNDISQYFPDDSVFIPSSSGGTFTTAYQAIELHKSQQIYSNKSLASMGYGLAGAIGVALANENKIVVLGEGDGGFAQNLQELGTVSQNNLNLKMFIFDNDGYASIRMTQQNYFDGAWVGCDTQTGVGLPNLKHLAETYSIPYLEMTANNYFDVEVQRALSLEGPLLIKVLVDPRQTFFPKIGSKVTDSGTMVSDPIHMMTPALQDDIARQVFKYLELEPRFE